MKIGSLSENLKLEKRISITPETAKKYISLGFDITLQNNYGSHIGFNDEAYKNVGVNFSNDENTQMLMFSNGGTTSQSTVYEIVLPTNLSLDPDVDNGPQRIWNYSHPDLFFGKISGATKLQNGNVLITEGDYGLWEITPAKLIAWKYQGDSNLWRAYPTH